MDAAKSMGEEIGVVTSTGRDGLSLRMTRDNIILNNGDGFSFVAKDGSVCGFRGDVCEGNRIRCKSIPSIYPGARLFRNINTAFEKEIERNRCVREIEVSLSLKFQKDGERWSALARCTSEDGRCVEKAFDAGDQDAANMERMTGMLNAQLGKTAGIFRFILKDIESSSGLPFMSASSINGIRRCLADELDAMPCIKRDLLLRQVEKNLPLIWTGQKEISYKFNISLAVKMTPVLTLAGLVFFAAAGHGEHTDAQAHAQQNAKNFPFHNYRSFIDFRGSLLQRTAP
jgi:putative protease